MSKLSFCAISGNGMSPLAQIMKLKGHDVSGSDMSFDNGTSLENKSKLESIGIKIYPQDGSGISKKTDTLYISTIIKDSNPDIKAAKSFNIPIVERFTLLADLFHQYTNNIAIGGTSGKTTTTAMIGYALDRLGLKPCMINGGWLLNYKNRPGIPNFIYNEGDICVIEADESNGSIENYHPYISVLNSISNDHKDPEELFDIFTDFVHRAKHAAVVNIDCPLASRIKHPHKKTYSFSIKTNHADFWAYNIKHIPNGTLYSIDGREFKLNLIGDFNVSNALACIAVCSILGVDKFDTALALEGFLGTHRRLEVIGNKKAITVISDFSHNPEKVGSAVGALKNYAGRLIIMFQGHGPIQMKRTGYEIMEEIGKRFDKDDILIIPDIYNGQNDKEITGKMMADKAAAAGANTFYFSNRDEIKEFILMNAKKGDRIIIMGAVDYSLPSFAQNVLEAL